MSRRLSLLLPLAIVLVFATKAVAFWYVLPELLAEAVSSVVLQNAVKRVLLVGSAVLIGYEAGRLYNDLKEKKYIVRKGDSITDNKEDFGNVEWKKVAYRYDNYFGIPIDSPICDSSGCVYTVGSCQVASYHDGLATVVCPVRFEDLGVPEGRISVLGSDYYFWKADVSVEEFEDKNGEKEFFFKDKFEQDLVNKKVVLPSPDIVVEDENGDGTYDDVFVWDGSAYQTQTVSDTVLDDYVNDDVVTSDIDVSSEQTADTDEISDYFENFPQTQTDSEAETDTDTETGTNAESQAVTADDIAQAIDQQAQQDAQSIVAPALPAVPEFDAEVDTPDVPNIVEKVKSFIPILNISNRIKTNFTGCCRIDGFLNLWGSSKSYSIDFCRFQSQIDSIGNILVMVAGVIAIFILFGL